MDMRVAGLMISDQLVKLMSIHEDVDNVVELNQRGLCEYGSEIGSYLIVYLLHLLFVQTDDFLDDVGHLGDLSLQGLTLLKQLVYVTNEFNHLACILFQLDLYRRFG